MNPVRTDRPRLGDRDGARADLRRALERRPNDVRFAVALLNLELVAATAVEGFIVYEEVGG